MLAKVMVVSTQTRFMVLPLADRFLVIDVFIHPVVHFNLSTAKLILTATPTFDFDQLDGKGITNHKAGDVVNDDN